MWVDPPFEGMVSNASLIAVCEVTEGGTWSCKVKVLDVVKGKKPEDQILVGGYNNSGWPSSAIEKEALKTGGKYLLFLEPSEYIHMGFGVSKENENRIQEMLKAGEIKTNEVARLRQRMGRRKYGNGYSVPTPSSGDYPIKDNSLYGGWFDASYPQYAPAISSEIALPLIEGLVKHQSGREPVEARKVLEKHLTVALVEGIKTPEEDKEYPKADAKRYTLFEWLMCAQATYGNSDKLKQVSSATDHEWYRVRTLAARALRSLPENKESLTLAKKLLEAKESPVQTEAANSLIAGQFTPEKAGKLVVANLKKSDSSRTGPDNIMVPVRNYSGSGRETMIRAVTHFGLAKDAHDHLIALIRDDGLNSGVFDALCEHFIKHKSDKARDRFIELARRCPPNAAGYFVEYFFREGSTASLKEIGNKLVDEEVGAVERSRWLKQFYYEKGIDHPVLNDTLTKLSKQEVDDYFAPGVLGLLIIRNKPSDKKAIDSMFRDKRLRDFNLADCFELMLLFQGESKWTEETLLFLLENMPGEPSVVTCGLLLPTPKVITALKNIKKPEKTSSFVGGVKDTTALRDAVLKAIELKLSPPASKRQQIDGWLSLLDKKKGIGTLLWCQLATVDFGQDKDYLAAKLRELIKKDERNALEALTLLSVLRVPLTSSEKELLAKEKNQQSDIGPVPKRDWDAVFRTQIKKSGINTIKWGNPHFI